MFEVEYLERLKPGGAALILDHYVRAVDIPRNAENVLLKPGSVRNDSRLKEAVLIVE